MKTVKRMFMIYLLPAWILQGCGSGSNINSSGPLGSLPGIVEKYDAKIEKIENELKEVRDINKAFALGKEKEALKEERVKKFDEAFKAMPTPVNIAFEQTGDKSGCEVKSMRVSGVHSGGNVVFEIEYQVFAEIPAMGWGPEFIGIFLDSKNQVIGKEWYFFPQIDRSKGVKKGDILKSTTGGPIDGRYGDLKKVQIKLKEK